MNSKEYKQFLESYNAVYEQTGVKVPSGASDTEALKGLIPKGDKVHEVPKKKSTLQNASYELEGDIIDEAGALSGRNYGDPVSAKWNKDMERFNVKGSGREMTPPSIPSGYDYNKNAGTITKRGAAPVPPAAKPTPSTSTSRNLSGLSVGPGGFNINNKPVRTAAPVTPDSKRDPEFRRGPGSGAGDMNAGRPAAKPAAKPAPTAAKPAAKPAPTAAKPAAKPAPTRNGFGAPTAVRAAQASVSSATAPPAKKPSISSQLDDLKKMGDESRKRQGLSQSFDIFDIIKAHLLDEGYADTEKEALAIMANMSEEWKHSIVEGDALRNTIKTLEGKRDAMNANKPGSANTAAPGKQSVGAAAYNAYQRLRGV
jgi:hypothetical protein